MFWNQKRLRSSDGRQNLHPSGTGKVGPATVMPSSDFPRPKHLCMAGRQLSLPMTKTIIDSMILKPNGYPRSWRQDRLKTQLNRPHGVAITPDGTLWICDSWNDRVLTLKDY